MGVVGYDRQPGSPTQRQTRDYGRWVNYSPWGGHGNVMDQDQKVSTFDGVSHLCGYFLLRLCQALPEEDDDREKYLRSARWLADTVVGFKDVRDPDQHFRPYFHGGIPQVFPYGTMKSRAGVDASKDYPHDIPRNLMPTLNDDAVIGALLFRLCLVEDGDRPSVNFNARQIDHYFGLDTEVHFFGKWECSPSRVDQTLGDSDASTGFFLPRKENVAGTARLVVHDDTFCARMRFLAWGCEQATKTP